MFVVPHQLFSVVARVEQPANVRALRLDRPNDAQGQREGRDDPRLIKAQNPLPDEHGQPVG